MCWRILREATKFKDEYVSTDKSSFWRLPPLIATLLADCEKRRCLRRSNFAGFGRGARQPPRHFAESRSDLPALEKYARDLTELARRGKLDPVIGRDEEIRRVMQILRRRTKNNPVLIGEPGVGKDGHRRRPGAAHHSGDVPEVLKTKRIVALDLGAMVAGRSIAANSKIA